MNDTPQNDRTWTDVLGLVLFATGAFASTLLVLALTDDPVSGQASTGAAAMGHGLLWAGGAVPVFMMSIACLLLGASQFLGYQDARRVTRHLLGVLGMAMGVSVVLGAFSESAGGLLGETIGGGLSGLLSAPVAALVGLVGVCAAAWAAWMTPSRAKAWATAQEIEKQAVPLQAKADGVTSEESAAIAFEGEPGTFPEVSPSPYPDDVRIIGEIPEGAAALGAEETSNHDEITEQSGNEGLAPGGPEAAAGAESEGDALLLATDQGDQESAGEDLAVSEEATALDSATATAPEDELSASWAEEELLESSGVDEEPAWSGGGEVSDEEPEVVPDDAEEEEWEEEEEVEVEEGEGEVEVEYEDAAELEEEAGEGEEEEVEIEDAAELEEEAGEEEEVETEDAAELEEEAGEEEEVETEDAAELEEEDEEGQEEEAEEPETSLGGSLEQGDLFGQDEDAQEPEVVLEPQARPAEEHQEILMNAADLFLDRDRVAVSLLQRQFRLDFEESCAILDELQEMGLIGPYLGGNRRDILLTRDEWLERVGGAT